MTIVESGGTSSGFSDDRIPAETKVKVADVLIVGINYFPEATGIAPYTTAMAEALACAGLNVRVITGVPHYPAWRLLDERYQDGSRWEEIINGLPVTRVDHVVPPGAGLLGRAKMESSFMRRARQAVAESPSRAVIAVTPSLGGLGAAVRAARGRPLGVVVQDLTGAGATQSGSAGSLAGRAIESLEMSMLRKATLVGVITARFGSILQQRGIDSGRILDVANFSHVVGVAAEPAAARAKLGWDLDGLAVVHTGNMGMKQGLESVVSAARLAEERNLPITFVLIGDGNQRAKLLEMAGDCRRLRILDPLSSQDYPYALAAADVLLLNERPGVSEMSLPSKLTSYVTAARPVLAAVEPGGITHSVLAEHGAAAIMPPGSPEDLLAEALKLGSDRQRCAELVASAQRLGEERYGRAAAHDRYLTFARALLSAA